MAFSQAEILLVATVAAVGVLHTIVPDHWVPITLIARQRKWTRNQTARAALIAGTGHVLSTLAIAIIVWVAGVAAAKAFGAWISTLTSIALIAFGAWVAISAFLEMHRGDGHGHSHGHTHDGIGEDHDHHYHDHDDHDHHDHSGEDRTEPQRGLRTALLLILGSSPMVEGIPAFFAAGRYGPGLIIVMSLVFAAATIATYVFLCVASVSGLKRVRFGSLEKYGEVLSGAFIALVGLIFWIWPVL